MTAERSVLEGAVRVALGVALAGLALLLVLGGRTFFRDRAARATAEAHPTLAWGSHGLQEMAEQLLSVTSTALLPPARSSASTSFFEGSTVTVGLYRVR